MTEHGSPRSERIRVLVVDDNPGDVGLIRDELSHCSSAAYSVSEAGRLAEALVKLGAARFDVVVLDMKLPDSTGPINVAALRARAPSVPIVVLSCVDDEATKLASMESGADGYLVKSLEPEGPFTMTRSPCPAPETATSTDTPPVAGTVPRATSSERSLLAWTIRYAIQRRRQLSLRTPEPTSGSTISALAPSRTPALLGRGRLMGVMSARGGAGGSTVALNLAAALAQEHRRVILVELTPHVGGLAVLLKQHPVTTLRGLLELDLPEIDRDSVRRHLHRDPRGFDVLFSPQQGRHYQDISPSKASAILQALIGLADDVIVDVPSLPTRALQSVVRQFRRMCLVVPPDVAGATANRATSELLVAWGLDPRRLVTIVSCTRPSHTAQDEGETTSLLAGPRLAVVPAGGDELRLAESAGLPLVASRPDHPMARAITALASALHDLPAAEAA